jgi:transposase
LHNDVGSVQRVNWFAAKQTKAREGANVMLIIGCDFHPRFQQIAIFDNPRGEVQERGLRHRDEAEQFYASLGRPAGVGMEGCGHYPWFEQLLARCGQELWLGDAAHIRAGVVRKQKTDRRDAEHILQLLLADRFPKIWVPSLEERDARSWRNSN